MKSREMSPKEISYDLELSAFQFLLLLNDGLFVLEICPQSWSVFKYYFGVLFSFSFQQETRKSFCEKHLGQQDP
jgi:hypothetical protein